jgi:hypothetical protein
VERRSRVFLKVAADGRIEEAQRTWTRMPQGYTHELEGEPPAGFLSGGGLRRFWMGPEGITPRTELRVSASKDRALVGEVVVVEIPLPEGKTEIEVLVDGEAHMVPASFELEWTEPASVQIEVSEREVAFRASPIIVTFEAEYP